MPRKKAETQEKKPLKKKATKAASTSPTKVTVSRKNEEVAPSETKTSSTNRLQKIRFNKKFWVILAIIVLLVLAYANKKFFVAAMVNNQPITSLELSQRLDSLYRDRVLNQMINEKILDQEAVKKGVRITDAQINDRLNKDIQDQYGGQDSLNAMVSQQGLDVKSVMDQLRSTARLELLAENLYKDEITPTDAEVQKFLDQNKDNPEATDTAKFKQTAYDTVKNQKLSDVFSKKFQELKQNAKVTIF